VLLHAHEERSERSETHVKSRESLSTLTPYPELSEELTSLKMVAVKLLVPNASGKLACVATAKLG